MQLYKNPKWYEIDAWMAEGTIEQNIFMKKHFQKYHDKLENLKYLKEIKAIRLRLTLAIIEDILHR